MEDVKQNNDMSSQINEISSSLCKAQAELESAKKDNSGYGYNYSDLNSVIKTAKPILAKHELSIVQLVGKSNDREVELNTILAHSSGQFFKSSASIAIPEMKGCNLAQQTGSAISYLRRYAYQSILGMSSEDNDASSQGLKKTPKTEPKKQTEVSKPSSWT